MNALVRGENLIVGTGDLWLYVLEAARRWGSVNIKADPAVSRDLRLKIKAYAEARGIPFSDENDASPGGALHPPLLARLPAQWRQARAKHLANNIFFRMACILRLPFQPRVLTALLTVTVLYVLLGVACGFGSPVEFTRYVFGLGPAAYQWSQDNPDEAWKLTRILAAVGIYGIGVVLWVRFLKWRDRAATPAMPVTYAAPVPVRRHEIENFREQSAFGDASLAQKQAVARALQGNAGDFAPKFED